MKTGRRFNRPTHRPFWLLLIAIVFAVALIGVASARFFYTNESKNSVQAKEFYFTSNLLDGKTHTLAPGSTSITFDLTNHEDALRYSETAIDYEVKVDGNTPTGTNLTGTLSAGSVQDASVTITGLVPGSTYTVTAKGVGGYYKTLSATLVIPEAENSLYKYLDTSNPDYVLLTVWAKGAQGDVSITAPSSVIPDNTDEVMRSVKKGEAFTDTVSFKDNDYCSHVYRFFGSGVTAEQFTVTYGTSETITATEKAPN